MTNLPVPFKGAPREEPAEPFRERRDSRGLRLGWTTGTCASAAAKAAAMGLYSGSPPKMVDVSLPDGSREWFEVENEGATRAAVIKDAGDDPDCTHGARITAKVSLARRGPETETELLAGPGVGTVTKPGLGLPVGEPSITPVPRRMILAALAEVTNEPLTVVFSVPDGEAMAAHTSNARLGIVGGISILGTTGVVKPYSTAAWRASIVQQIDVAATQGEPTMVLATGSRTERLAMRLFPSLDEVCFLEVGDYTGTALKRMAQVGMVHAVVVGMAGKLSKLASGVMMTHFRRSKVDGQLLAAVAKSVKAPAAVVKAATATNTARHFFETCIAEGAMEPLQRVSEMAREACEQHTNGVVSVDVLMADYEGQRIVASA
ncbi:MAG TPA: cobalt-precorrin-5B (C(1))-methyltransferase [Acidimicrobiales bacterium]|nr:cobalt-precorrin-5B (C(1))-methyltransferase [Acidimicrobiales bacterium]